MRDATSDTSESDENGVEARRARSVRFSDVEWKTVEMAATDRGMNAAEFARHAVIGVATGCYGVEQAALPP